MRRALFSLLTAALIATVAGPAVAGPAVAGTAVAGAAAAAAAPRPKFESAAPFAAWNNGGFILYNNEWNPSAGPQTIWGDSYGNWGVQSDQAAGNTAVETYPSVQEDFDNARVSSFPLIRNGFTESMPAAAGLDAETADDVWLDNYGIEVMIWVDNHGQTPAGRIISHATIFGQHFAVWGSGPTFTFALDHNETSGVTHILATLQWMMEHGYVSSSATLAQVDFGWEVASTGGSPMNFTMTNYWLHS